MVFLKENYAFCWSIIQTNVNIMVEILCYKTYIYWSASKNGENNEGLG